MSLATCESGHEELCYDGGYMGNGECPACEAIKERDDEISTLKEEVSDLESKVESLESELEAAED